MNIVSFSGGKDSTAMLLMMIDKGITVDRIICVDTTKEFPQMYEHIKWGVPSWVAFWSALQRVFSGREEILRASFAFLEGCGGGLTGPRFLPQLSRIP